MRINNFDLSTDGRNFIFKTMGKVKDEESKNFGKDSVLRTVDLSNAKSVATHLVDTVLMEQIDKGILDLEKALIPILKQL